MKTESAILVSLVVCFAGLAVSLILQVWVQPKWFREDNRRQADLIIGRFDAQLTALRIISENATKALEEASSFFKTAEDRFQEVEKRLALLEQQWHTTHRLVEQVTKLDKRLSCVESVCNRQHKRSLVYEMDRRRDEEEG